LPPLLLSIAIQFLIFLPPAAAEKHFLITVIKNTVGNEKQRHSIARKSPWQRGAGSDKAKSLALLFIILHNNFIIAARNENKDIKLIEIASDNRNFICAMSLSVFVSHLTSTSAAARYSRFMCQQAVHGTAF
jgi:hypothetical protein